MNYTIIWESSAEQDLAAIWLTATDRSAVSQAAFRLEWALNRQPFFIGIARTASVNRTAIDPPLGIDYEIIEDDKKVRVLRVWAV